MGGPESPVLHIANGHSTTRLIEKAGLPGTTAVWADPLHDGPVPADVSDAELIRTRARFLGGANDAPADIAAELTAWRTTLDRFVERDAAFPAGSDRELVLWFEHDLFDQLNLVHLLDRLAGLDRGRTLTSLVSADSFPGRSSFKGFGELTPADLASLFPARERLTSAHFALAARAWRAFRSDDPRAIASLVAGDTSALPYLGPALRRHLEDFPSVSNGLSRSEQHLLDLLSKGETDIWTAFSRMHEGETHFYISDASFWSMARRLAESHPALIEVQGSEAADGLPKGRLNLTPSGEEIRAGRKDLVAFGVDRWMGGVHLQGYGPLWRFDGASLVYR